MLWRHLLKGWSSKQPSTPLHSTSHRSILALAFLVIRDAVKQRIWCRIRKDWVVDQPEEQVRQQLLNHLIEDLKFPESLVAIERKLSQMPHLPLDGTDYPDRRSDIVCFANDIFPGHSLYPLLLIECKAVPMNSKTERQVIGYNHYLGSPFVCIANETERRIGWRNEEGYQWQDGIPAYQTLLDVLSSAH